MSEINHKLAAIVFTDIVGYTRQMEEDEERMLHLLQQQRDIISPIVKSYNGEIIKELGDGLLLMFNSAVDAVRCGISIQTRLAGEDLTIRAGIHIGEVIFKDGDVFGSAVNVAARIQPLASANGVCISDAVKKQIQNQTDIRLNSIGAKTLKGIKDPVEIFEVIIEGVTNVKKKDVNYFFNELLNRRVFHVMAVYLLGAWIIRMAVSYFVTSNLKSPHLIDLAWVILLSLLPTVFLLTYFHGFRSSGKWSKAELIGFPSNAVFSIILIIFMFNGKDLGAATTTVTYEDENGKRTERTVLKNEFRKKTLLFFFENESSDSSLNWLQYAIPNLIEYDASQDIFLEVWGAGNFIWNFRQKGINDVIRTSLGQKKKLAEDFHRSTFLTGSFSYSEGKYSINTKLYETRNAGLIAENNFSGKDLFLLIDQIMVSFKNDLEIPDGQIENVTDMPVAEIYTASQDALEHFTRGYYASVFKNNWAEGISSFKQATSIDKDFLIANYYLGLAYMLTNKMEESLKSFKMVVDFKDKLPQRYQFLSQILYLSVQNNTKQILKVCELWKEVSPEDIAPRETLVRIYGQLNEVDKLISESRGVVALDPENTSFLRILGYSYLEKGISDSALYYFEQYKTKSPNDASTLLDIGKLYLKQADFHNAKRNFEKLSLLEPGNTNALLMIASVELEEGRINQALSNYNKALILSKSAPDSAGIYFELSGFYRLKGELIKSFEYYNKYYSLASGFIQPIILMGLPLENVDKYILAGKADEIFALLINIEKTLQPPFENGVKIGFVRYNIELGKAEDAEANIKDAEAFYKASAGEKSLGDIFFEKARIAEIRKQYQTAMSHYIKFKELTPSSVSVDRRIAMCQRELGNLKEAKKSIEKALRLHPFNPQNNLEAAMIYLKMNEKKNARVHLNRALLIWKDADAGYKPYQQALAVNKALGIV
ncbi:MAG: tetratricopeptide repeat protein [Bacteroidota bacterium]